MAETKKIVIQGVDFEAPVPYAEGHVLTANEARHLNQTYHENLRNNFAKTVKAAEAGEGPAPAELPDLFAKYASEYTLDAARATGGGRQTLDPIEREARALAREFVKQKLAERGQSLTAPKDATDEAKEAYKEQIAAKIEEIAGRDEFLTQARKNVEGRAKSLAKIAESLDI